MMVAFIPVRGGSKSIHLKNIKDIAGKPLVYWVAKAASDCDQIDVVYVATDNSLVRDVVEKMGLSKVIVIGRSDYTASDTASTESVLLEFVQNYQFDDVILIQATSPLLRTEDIMAGLDVYRMNDTDSVLSVVRQKRFCWEVDSQGYAEPTNYDVYNRPRRQEFEGYLVENGAFYITSREKLLQSKNRVSGKIRVSEMDESTYFEIDEPSDWEIIENQLKLREEKMNVGIPDIKMFLTDCDGCLTDGGMYYSENGDELKKFDARDGMGFQLLQARGIITGIITGEKMNLNQRRASKLNLDILKMGVKDKKIAIRQLSEEYGIPFENIAFVGDDINDKSVIELVGYGCAVSNGIDEVKAVAKYVSSRNGGNGAVREIIDRILKHKLNEIDFKGKIETTE